MTPEAFAEELDLALAALRRVILKGASLNPAQPVTLVSSQTSRPSTGTPPADRKVIAPVQFRAQPKPMPGPKVVTPPPAAKAEPEDAEIVEYNGVTVNLTAGTVEFCRETVSVPRRHAQVIAVLARAMPNVMPRDAIIARAWPDLATSSGYTLLSQTYQDMRQSLSKIGLKLNDVPRFGFALCVADDGEGDDGEA